MEHWHRKSWWSEYVHRPESLRRAYLVHLHRLVVQDSPRHHHQIVQLDSLDSIGHLQQTLVDELAIVALMVMVELVVHQHWLSKVFPVVHIVHQVLVLLRLVDEPNQKRSIN